MCIMEETIKLYYDSREEKFSLMPTDTNKVVFESHNRIGWVAGRTLPIKCGLFEIQISSNIYPMFPHREYLCVDVYVKGVLLLPISKACRLRCSQYALGQHEIAFTQFGSGNNADKSPHTVVQLNPLDWLKLLVDTRNICNNYQEWLLKEAKDLINSVDRNRLNNEVYITELISIVRNYDELVPEIIPVYRQFIDKRCIDCFTKMAYWLSDVLPNLTEDEKKKQKRFRLKEGDVLWKYIKDYRLSL